MRRESAFILLIASIYATTRNSEKGETLYHKYIINKSNSVLHLPGKNDFIAESKN